MPRYDENDAREAIAAARSYAEALRLLGMTVSGANTVTLRKYAEHWGISTEHFNPRAAGPPCPGQATPLDQILVAGSTFHRGHLKAGCTPRD